MKKIMFLLVSLIYLSNISNAQNEVKVFDSYEDYVAGKTSSVYKELISFSPNKTVGKSAEGIYDPILVFKDEKGQKNKISIQKNWGFVYRDILFRNSEAKYQNHPQANPENLYFALWGKIDDSLLIWVNAINVFEDELKVFKTGRSTEISYGDKFHYSSSVNGNFYFESDLITTFKSHKNQINTALKCFYETSKVAGKGLFKNKKTGVVDYEKFFLAVNNRFHYVNNSVIFECVDKIHKK